MVQPSKGALARHVLKPHGTHTVTTPEQSLATWSMDELEQLHTDLMVKHGTHDDCQQFGDVLVQVAQAPAVIELQPEFREVFEAATAAVAQISTTLLDLVLANPDDVQGVAAAQALVEQLRRDLALLMEEITQTLWEAMGDNKEMVVDGVGFLQKYSGKQHKAWRHDEVWSAIRRAAVGKQYRGGGYNPKRSDVVNDTLDLVREVVGAGSYKSTGIRNALGLEADEFSEVSWGKRAVRITGGNS